MKSDFQAWKALNKIQEHFNLISKFHMAQSCHSYQHALLA